jgi:hypothetical protein
MAIHSLRIEAAASHKYYSRATSSLILITLRLHKALATTRFSNNTTTAQPVVTSLLTSEMAALRACRAHYNLKAVPSTRHGARRTGGPIQTAAGVCAIGGATCDHGR